MNKTDENKWDVRLKEEYAQLKDRLEKLHRINLMQEAADTAPDYVPEFQTKTPAGLLHRQESVMGEYLHVLELRAAIEGVDLG